VCVCVRYLYPKEVFIAHGVLQPAIGATKNVGNAKAAKAERKGKAAAGGGGAGAGAGSGGGDAGLSFVYPYGATLSVERPAVPILSSGPISYPLNRPVAAVFECPDAPSHLSGASAAAQAAAKAEAAAKAAAGSTVAHGRVMVLGSAQLFGDEWLDKEENGKLADVLFRWLAHDKDAANLTEDRKVRSCLMGTRLVV